MTLRGYLGKFLTGGKTPSPGPAASDPEPATGPEEPSGPVVHHLGFDIPRRLAWRTGTLPDFTTVSQKHMVTLRRFGALEQARHIVEIGCGVGRDAISLIPLLPPEGSYLGIDIMPDSIAWAQGHITPRDPRFSFVHFDVADKQHNPGGTETMQDHRIPRAPGSTDLVYLFSVFTHMFPADLAQYLRDFARILRPGGHVVATMFVITEGLPAHLLRIGGGGARNLTFRHEIEPGFFHNDPAVVPGATAYALSRLEQEAAAAGLEVTRFALGAWSRSGPPETTGQDVVVFTRP
ncbi:class I SAM-dependent methyltransferase [Salipiger sp.]|uniref:class I SAM-dependent methyltransferase n=1 Tax=Salipiger sp. TaxID=2078585 RepID=UPI003A9886A7